MNHPCLGYKEVFYHGHGPIRTYYMKRGNLGFHFVLILNCIKVIYIEGNSLKTKLISVKFFPKD